MSPDELRAAGRRLLDQARKRQGLTDWPPPELIARVVALALPVPAAPVRREGGRRAG